MLSAHAQTPATGGQVWSTANLFVRLPSHLQLIVGGEANIGTNYAYQQWSGTMGLTYQWKRIGKLQHLVNINQDKESRVVFGTGYQYLWTEQDGATSYEDRAAVDVTPRVRPHARWLVEDRNRVEFRWVNGEYSTRYRNLLAVERDIRIDRFRFTPYVSGEFFYNGATQSWDEQQYAVGVQWPYRRVLMLQTYYLRQHTTSAPDNVNVVGLTLNMHLRNGR